MAMTSPSATSPDQPFTLHDLNPEPPKKRRTGLIVVAGAVAAVVIAAGIATAFAVAGTDKPTASTSPSTAAVTTGPPPGTATIKQYASVVSPSIKDLRKQWDDYQANYCGVQDQNVSVPCALAPMTFGLMAHTLELRLTGASRLGGPTYIGVPPGEITTLVRDTTNAAQLVEGVVNKDGTVDGGPPVLYMAVSKLMTVLDEWDPYLS